MLRVSSPVYPDVQEPTDEEPSAEQDCDGEREKVSNAERDGDPGGIGTKSSLEQTRRMEPRIRSRRTYSR
jgi:hypothetical protein